MITEGTFIKLSGLLAGATLVGTDALVKHLPMFSGEHELNFVLYLIGGLLTLLAGMTAMILWFIRDLKLNNRNEHDKLFKGHVITATALSHLQGEHEASYRAKGCAYDSECIQKSMDKAVGVAMKTHEHRRHDDCPLNGNGAANGSHG